MKKLLAGLAFGASLLTMNAVAFAGDAESCKDVRMSDVGWTDITAITAMTGAIDWGCASSTSQRSNQRNMPPLVVGTLTSKYAPSECR